MKQISYRRFSVVVLLVGACFLKVGCDENTLVTPFSDREAYFTVFGFISTADTQLVRVIPIRNDLERDVTSAELDVTVQTTRLSNGSTEEWQQVLPVLEDGSRGLAFSDSTFGHVFRAVFTPFAGEDYRLEIIRADGKVSSAEVTVPTVAPPIISDVFVRNDSILQSVTWPDVDSAPRSIEVVYRLNSILFDPEIQLPAIPVSYDGEGYFTDNGWTVDIDLVTDVAFVRRFVADNFSDYSPLPSVEDVDTYEMGHADIRMRVIVGDSLSRSMTDSTSLALLAQPGVFTNVENGFGFFGAAGTNSRLWELPPDIELRQAIGFSY